MNKYHFEILNELKIHAGEETKHRRKRNKNYIGTKKFCYNIKSGIKKQIVKEWIKKHNNLSFSEYIALLSSLYKGNSYDEISIAGKLLGLSPKLRGEINPNILDIWLNNIQGWAEVDSLCQSNFSANEILDKWENWHNLIFQLSVSGNVHKRRASLVLLTKPVRDLKDTRLSILALGTIDKLKKEKDILITKSISWLLRDMVKNYRKDIQSYLNENMGVLPKIAIRETKRKLLTGKK